MKNIIRELLEFYSNVNIKEDAWYVEARHLESYLSRIEWQELPPENKQARRRDLLNKLRNSDVMKYGKVTPGKYDFMEAVINLYDKLFIIKKQLTDTLTENILYKRLYVMISLQMIAIDKDLFISAIVLIDIRVLGNLIQQLKNEKSKMKNELEDLYKALEKAHNAQRPETNKE